MSLDSLIRVGDQGGSRISSICDNTGDLLGKLLGGGLSSLAGALDSLAGSLGRGLDGHVVDLVGLGNALDTDKFRLEDCDTMLGVVAPRELGWNCILRVAPPGMGPTPRLPYPSSGGMVRVL